MKLEDSKHTKASGAVLQYTKRSCKACFFSCVSTGACVCAFVMLLYAVLLLVGTYSMVGTGLAATCTLC